MIAPPAVPDVTLVLVICVGPAVFKVFEFGYPVAFPEVYPEAYPEA
jgi:hypothetical protein